MIELYENLTNAEYHENPALGRSDALVINKSGTATLKYNRENPVSKSSPALEFGSMFHDAMEDMSELDRKYAIEPEGDKRTKAYKEEAEALRAQYPDKKFVSLADYQAVVAMADAVKRHPRYLELDYECLLHEVSLFGHVRNVLIKARPDAIDLKNGLIIDWKTTSDASPNAFTHSVRSFGYYMQPPWYLALVEPFFKQGFKFLFFAVEKNPPYNVAVYELGGGTLARGKREMDEALAKWDEAVSTGKYKAYPEGVMTLDVFQEVVL